MIHPHLKSNEELLSIWNGDFHDIDQMQALEQLARRRVDDFSEQLKLALASGDLDHDDIKWTYFEYIYDNSFVIDYVNNPKSYYNKEKAISYIEWAISNNFCLSDYLKLNNKAKDELQHLFINKLKEETTYICDFESYIMRYGSHDHLQIFEEAIEHIINKDYIEFLKQNKETSRLMAIDSQIAKMKNMLHQSFVSWLYGIRHPSANPSTHCHRGYERTVGHFKHPYDYSESVLLKKLQDILSGANLKLGEMPDVYITYELPRSFRLVDNHDEGDLFDLLDTENLLGYYIPEKQEINLMALGIQWCAKVLNIDVDLLSEIVFIHELGHYMQHKMPCYQTQEWKYDLYIRSYTPIDLQEGWAQLMAAWVVKDKEDYSHVFQSLIAVQSAPYHVFKDYERDPYRRILNSLDGLRQLGRPAKITDWETFL